MTGFTAVICDNKNIINKITSFQKNTLSFENEYINQKIIGNNYIINQFTLSKFLNDKSFQEDSEYIIGIEGVILNLQQLKEITKQASVFEIIKFLFNTEGNNFAGQLRGDFSGFIYSKRDDKWFVFTNPVNSKRIFYYHRDNLFIFSSELKNISHILYELNLSVNLDKNAAYLLITYGFMLEDITLIDSVKSLRPGNMLIVKDGKISLHEYFHLQNISHTKDSKEVILEKMDELFVKAVRLEFEKDNEYNYKHIATLSGGLDSRMVVLMADKLGYKEQLNFTFSQSNYLDELIAKKIASDYGHEFLFQSLDNGNYLKDIDKAVFYNDGLITYSGSAHVMMNIGNMNFTQYGMIHTGMVGDAVIGSFLSQPYLVPPSVCSGVYSAKKLPKISSFVSEIVKKYPSEELYKFYNRAFMGAMNGYNYFETVSQATSPFLDVDFLSYCYSIPENLKYKQNIYLEWIAAKHPEFARYPWEKTGVSPLKSTNYKRYLDIGYYRRMSLKLFDRLSGNLKSGMNPFDAWMTENTELTNTIKNYFQSHIYLLDKDKELREDCISLFNAGNAGEKFQVLTLLAAIKLHNLNM
ncbi:MAG: asparagine synthetase B family protein [Paludibacteraceae bacterium]